MLELSTTGNLRSRDDIKWCFSDGRPSSLAIQKPLSSISDVCSALLKPTAADVVFRNPDSFVAGEVDHHYDVWNYILTDYFKRDEILKYISKGVSVYDFLQPIKGMFKGKSYDSDIPPKASFHNSNTCSKFEDFISSTILERVHNGSLSIWGKEGEHEPPHLVMPITVEPSKPRMWHDERFLNLWMKTPLVTFDLITDLPSYVDPNHYQSKLDDKSGYDHFLLSEVAERFLGCIGKVWFLSVILFPWLELKRLCIPHIWSWNL